MKTFWSDREGVAPPPHSTFHIRSFDSIEHLSFTPEWVDLPPPKTYQVLKKTFLPSFETWKMGVERALDLIHRKILEKVVLGRLCFLDLSETPDPFAIAASLKQKAQGAFLFCAKLGEESFLGASPERLFCRTEKKILSEAVAGTRPRGKNALQDEAYREELLKSPKEIREFNPVQEHIQKTLSPLCKDALHLSPLSVHQTRNVQHLYRTCSGRLKENILDIDILSSLHPTPALCGSPTQEAKQLIQEIEPFQRGLFGGAIGWSTPDKSEYVVGIRSCFLKGNQAILFSGTGIVEGSDPEEEWEELNQKLKLYDGILDH